MSEKTIPALAGVAKIASSVRRYFAFTNYHNIICYLMQALSDSIEQQRQSEDKVTRGQVQKCRSAEAKKGPRIQGAEWKKSKRAEEQKCRKGSRVQVKKVQKSKVQKCKRSRGIERKARAEDPRSPRGQGFK
jgi:hypothetical protein